MSRTPLRPLRPPVLHLLLALASGPSHGYALAQVVEARTGGRVRIGPGTLYASIQRMEKARLIEETEAPAGADADARPRRFYRLTEVGRARLVEELSAMESLVRHARSLSLLPAPAGA
ncbi:MAG: PadR family transcriptional regulator [Gemmatimonadota bacterium]